MTLDNGITSDHSSSRDLLDSSPVSTTIKSNHDLVTLKPSSSDLDTDSSDTYSTASSSSDTNDNYFSSSDKSLDKSFNESMNNSMKKPTNMFTNIPMDKSSNISFEKSSNKTKNISMDKSTIPNLDYILSQFQDATDRNIFNEKNNNVPAPASPNDVNLDPSLVTKNVIDLEEALEDGRRMMILFIDNRFEEAVSTCFEKGTSNMIYAAGMGAIKSLEGLLTVDTDHIEEAIKYMKFANEYASNLRKKHGYTSFLFKNDYNSYTDEEAHAELIYAETLIAMGLLSIIGDQSIYGLINAAFKIRASHQTYKECLSILHHKDNWSSDNLRIHFESGTRLGVGAFDLFISMFPNKLAKLLEYVGFSSDREVALDELNKAVCLVDGIMYDITSILLSCYYGFVEYFYGCGEGDISFFEKQSKVWAQRTPNSSIARIGLAEWAQITGKPDEAIKHYKSCAFGDTLWRQLQLASYWGMTWCYAMKCDWKGALENIKILRDECKWSPAMFTYLYAVFLFMQMEEETKPGGAERELLSKEISDNLKKIPQLKRTVGGRKVFHEKIVIERSKMYFNHPEEMMLPPLELCYIWNIFAMMYGNAELINLYLDRINNKYSLHQNDKGNSKDGNLDTYSYLTFMRGVCFRHLGSIDKAIDCFNEVLSCKKRISEEEKHLLPQSCFELGLIEKKLGNISLCKKWLKKARDDYSNYMTEVMIQYRTMHLLKQLKTVSKDISCDDEPLDDDFD